MPDFATESRPKSKDQAGCRTFLRTSAASIPALARSGAINRCRLNGARANTCVSIGAKLPKRHALAMCRRLWQTSRPLQQRLRRCCWPKLGMVNKTSPVGGSARSSTECGSFGPAGSSSHAKATYSTPGVGSQPTCRSSRSMTSYGWPGERFNAPFRSSGVTTSRPIGGRFATSYLTLRRNSLRSSDGYRNAATTSESARRSTSMFLNNRSAEAATILIGNSIGSKAWAARGSCSAGRSRHTKLAVHLACSR